MMNCVEVQSAAFLLLDEANSSFRYSLGALAQNDYPRVGKYISDFSG